VPDARSRTVRRRVARQVRSVDRSRELEALKWIEASPSSMTDEARRRCDCCGYWDYGKLRPAVIVQTDALPWRACVCGGLPDDF